MSLRPSWKVLLLCGVTGSVACLSVAKFPGGEPPPAASVTWTLSGRSFMSPAIKVDLRWTALAGAIATEGAVYRVYESPTLPVLVTPVPAAMVDTTSATIGATPGSHYYLVVSATADGGVSSPFVRVDTIPIGFDGLLPAPSPMAVVVATNGGAGATFDTFGSVATGVGDLNADGFDDIVVGDSSFNDAGGVDHGMVRLYLGTSGGLKPGSPWTFKGPAQSDFAGTSVAGIGSVLGADSIPDVVVGLPRVSPAGGAIRIFDGAAMAAGLSPTPVNHNDPIAATAPGSQFGHALSSGRDINGDGLTDLLVGAQLRGGGAADGPGSAHAYSAEGGAAAVWHASGGIDDAAQMGTSVGAGDVNRDGIADAIVGEPGTRSVLIYAGSPAFVGQFTSPRSTANWTLTSTLSNFGQALSAGDVDGDGFDDILVGSRPGPGITSGVSLFRGPLALTTGGVPGDTIADWTIENAMDAHLGSSVALVDVNGDGFKDALLGELNFLRNNTGRASLYRGGPGGLETAGPSPPWQFIGGPQSNMGAWVSAAGDVNGDGSPDFLVGATGVPGVDPNNGDRVYLFRGAPVRSPLVAIAELAGDVGTPVSMEVTAFFDPGRIPGPISCDVDWGAPGVVTNPAPISDCTRNALEALQAAYPEGVYTLRVRVTNAAGLTAETATTVVISP